MEKFRSRLMMRRQFNNAAATAAAAASTDRAGPAAGLVASGGGVAKRGCPPWQQRSRPVVGRTTAAWRFQQPAHQQLQRQQHQQLLRARATTRRRREQQPRQQQALSSSDPLNLRWVAAESQRRQLAGLSPMPGDSALGSPVLPSPSPAEGSPPTTATGELPPPPTPPPPHPLAYKTRRLSPGFKPIYGNYRAYYGKRLRAGDLNIGQMQDDRLALLQPDWYLGRDVLDIGCNDGVLSLKIAETLGVRSLTGVDIDGHLVQRAQRNLRLRVREAETEARVKRSLAIEGYLIGEVPQQPERTGFPYNVYFQTGNYVLESEQQLAKVEENKYDIIQAFSITKWIHLNWGDSGIKLFFRRAFRELRPDGKLILEPQPFQSYRKKLLCPQHKRNYAAILLKPEQFRDYLERECGFAHSLYISEQKQYHGFQRPVLMCTKPTGRTPAPPPPLPAPSSSQQQQMLLPAAPADYGEFEDPNEAAENLVEMEEIKAEEDLRIEEDSADV